MLSFFKSSVVPDGYSAEQLKKYSRLRLQVLAGAFLCYSAYYLVRKNFVMAMPDLVEHGYSKSDLGLILSALAVSYGISNFLMGLVCDRIDTRKLMPACLMGSAFISLYLGMTDIIQTPFVMLAVLLAINGCTQGTGWPASAKMVAHWFHPKERGQAMGLWNLSHNAGCGLLGPVSILAMTLFANWQSKFYLPAIIAFCTAIICFFLLRDKPAVVGLPSPFPEMHVEAEINKQNPSVFSSLKLFIKHCLNIPTLWILALANACVYFIRYGVIDWAPLFLTEARGLSFEASSWAFFAFEYAAIPGTLLCGYLSDHQFNGKRAPVNVLFMSFVAMALIFYWQCPDDLPGYSILSLITLGFVIYGPLMLIHVHIIDVVPLPFAATAAGFCGLFGYLIGTTSANLLLGHVVDMYGWDSGFQLLTGASLLTIGLLILLWLWENFHPNPNINFLCGEAQPVTLRVRDKSRET